MNLCFYEAVERLPLGIAVTIELFGPLGLAASLSRRRREFAYVLLAAVGVVMLGGATRPSIRSAWLRPRAATGWASYILLSRRTGSRFDGSTVLHCDGRRHRGDRAAGNRAGGTKLLEPRALLIGLAVAMLSGAIPFTLEIHALRAVGPRTFGVVMSTSPAVAGVMGWLVLHETLGWVQAAAIGCVVAASVGTAVATDATT
jgi:inner membrane transporter RhtA